MKKEIRKEIKEKFQEYLFFLLQIRKIYFSLFMLIYNFYK